MGSEMCIIERMYTMTLPLTTYVYKNLLSSPHYFFKSYGDHLDHHPYYRRKRMLCIRDRGRSWGRKRRGEVIGKRLHQAQSCTGAGLAGHRTWQDSCPLAPGEARSQVSPPVGKAGKEVQPHLPACQKRRALPGKDRNTLLVHPGKTRALV